MNSKIHLLVIIALVIGVEAQSGKPEITIEELKQHVSVLASDSLSGRKPGTPGGRKAAEYIASRFEEAGLKPLLDGWRQYFNMTSEVNPAPNNKFTYGDISILQDSAFVPVSYTAEGEVDAEVVFIGYGFEIDDGSLKWNDYKGLDVQGKWVMMLIGDPEPNNRESKFIEYSDTRQKIITARDKGAAGVLLVAGEELRPNDELDPLNMDRSRATASIPVINIKRKIADRILSVKKQNLSSLEKRLIEKRSPYSFEVPVEISAKIKMIKKQFRTSNIIGFIEGKKNDEYIVVGAHYDHLGMGGEGSGSRMPDTVAVHYGADDNASGVAGVIEIAEKFAKSSRKPERSMIFIAFGAEEFGLLGSKYFVDNSPIPIKNIKAMFNFDMIGRLDENKVMAYGVGTSEEAKDIINSLTDNAGLEFSFIDDGYGPSDHANFYAEDIPVIFLSTGAHQDYHTPFDNVRSINFPGQKKVADFAYKLIETVESRNQSLTYKEAGPKMRARHGQRFKVTLGIMPDFSSNENDGLGVGGVREGGPAHIGGMKKGDRIVAMNGKPVTNIYDYMHRLKKLESGQTITVDLVRDGKKVVLLIQL